MRLSDFLPIIALNVHLLRTVESILLSQIYYLKINYIERMKLINYLQTGAKQYSRARLLRNGFFVNTYVVQHHIPEEDGNRN
jgi:hypothetical protein